MPLFIRVQILAWNCSLSALVADRQVGKHVNICINEADNALLLWPLDSANQTEILRAASSKNQTISYWLPRINMYSLGLSWDPESMSDTGCFTLIYWQKYQALRDGGALRTWPEGQWAAKQIETWRTICFVDKLRSMLWISILVQMCSLGNAQVIFLPFLMTSPWKIW